jgi:uncharacterized protein YcbK (DUF882 family)
MTPACLRPALALAALLGLATTLFSSAGAADVEHTVMRGHTLEAIASRYHVNKKAIMDVNRLKPGQRLRVGEVLVIPGVNEKPGSTGGGAASGGAASGGAAPAAGGANNPAAASHGGSKGKADPHAKGGAPTYAARPKTPGVVHLTRIAMHEDYTVRVVDRRSRQAPLAPKQFEKLMRSPNGNAAHPIDPRLIALVGVVSDHFGGRKLEVISGYRPYTPTQYTAHSNHNHGRAIDFRVVGVPNEVVRDFCRTLRNTGCGYYPNSVFVHMDVRDRSAYWIDYSKPGEAPHYNAPNLDADEGAGDVHRESPSDNPAPTEAPPADPSTPAPSTPTPTPTSTPPSTPTSTPTSTSTSTSTPTSTPTSAPPAASPAPTSPATP